MNWIKLCLILLFQVTLLSGQKNFSFVFLPDIHLNADSSVMADFEQLVKQINKLHPDFVLTGGDMIYTAKNVNDKKAELLFNLMDKEFGSFSMPVYKTMGNHENVGITVESGIDKTNPNWGKQMYEKRYGKRYFSFIYNGWKFLVLDGIKILDKEKNYTQGIDSLQVEWIKSELNQTDKKMPLVISIHPPVVNPHALTSSSIKVMSPETEAVMGLFRDHNLKIVLEGHTHLYMNLYFNGIHYISGGSTADGTDPMDYGFMQVSVKNDKEDFQFIKPSGSSGFYRDISFSKPGKKFYREMPNPVKADIQAWSKIKKDVTVSFADDNIRYPKEKAPAGLNQTKWNVKAWKGERVHTQLLVWTKKNIESLKFSVTDLINNKGDRISAVNISPGFVRYVMTDEFGRGCDTRKTTEYDSSLVEDPIDIVDDLPVDANSVQPVWLTIRVPDNIQSGIYNGTITITTPAKYDMKITVTVLDHVLPPAGEWKYDLDLWQSAAAIAKVHDVGLWSEEHFDLMGPYFNMLALAGQKAITANIIDQPWGKGHVYHDDPSLIYWTKRKDGSWSYDYKIFDRYISTLMNAGINQRINCYTMVTWDLSFIYFDEALGRMDTVINAIPGSQAYADFWTPMIMDFTKHLKDKGWFNRTAVAMDERDLESMKAVITLLRKVDAEWKIALAGDYHPEVERDIYDYCINIGQTFPAAVLQERKWAGKPSTYYTACGTDRPNGFTYSEPAENVWISWYAAAEGFTGYLRWAYNNWTREPLLDSRFRTWPGGDLYQIYPGPRSSVRFEKFIEGIQDYEKIRILRQQFSRENKTGKMNELDGLLPPFTLRGLKGHPAAGMVTGAKKKLNSF